MNINQRISFDRAILMTLAGLAVLLAVVIAVGSRAGMPAPELVPPGGEVGAYGPVGLAFQNRLPDETLEDRLILQLQSGGDAVEGRLEWVGSTVWFWPAQPLALSLPYMLRLETGVKDREGRVLRQALTWEVSVRQPEVVYLAQVEAPDVWRNTTSGEDARQLTFTGGQVYDFAVSPSGDHLAYSAENAMSGLDLWEIGRNGGEPRLLLACGADRCTEPAYAPHGKKMLYTRSQASGTGTFSMPRIWLLDLSRLDTQLLIDDPSVGGRGPLWSPNGSQVAFYDDDAVIEDSSTLGGIRVVDLVNNTGFVLYSNDGAPGSWSPDSRELWYAGADVSGEEIVTNLFTAEISTQVVRMLIWEEPPLTRLGRPAWSPDGKWLAFAAQAANQDAGIRLWRSASDGTQVEEMTREPFYTYGSYHWGPSSAMLVFQRLELSSSRSRPQVAVWQADEIVLLAEDAALPQWLP